MSKIDAVLFDLDGTLLDSAPDFLLVLNQMLAARGKEPITLSDITHQVSNGARAMVSYAFNLDQTCNAFEPLKAEFLKRYLLQLNQASSLYTGIIELLEFLESRSFLWGVVTNKPELYTTPIMQFFGLDTRAAAIICPDHVTHTKPNPEPLLLACQQMSVSAAHTWYVGDHLRDIQAGKAAGMKTIGCNYGYLNKSEDSKSWNADFTVDNAQQIIDLIKQQTD
jgi:phosphoglycolate phosphatase